MENSRLNTFYSLATIQSRLNRSMPYESWYYDDCKKQVYITDSLEGDDVSIEMIDTSTYQWTVTGHSDTFDNIDDLIEFTLEWFEA